MRLAVSTPVFTPRQSHTHMTACTTVVTPLDPLIRQSGGSPVRLRPVMSVVILCPLIFPGCLCYVGRILVPVSGELGSFDTEKFVCLSVWSAEVTQRCVCLLGQSSPLTEEVGEQKWWREKHSLVVLPPCVFLLLVEMSRPPGPLPWLPDKMSGVAPHDLVLLVLWQRTTLKGNAGNHKYLGIKELYGVSCKRIYSSLGGDASVSKGSRRPSVYSIACESSHNSRPSPESSTK